MEINEPLCVSVHSDKIYEYVVFLAEYVVFRSPEISKCEHTYAYTRFCRNFVFGIFVTKSYLQQIIKHL